MSFYRRLRLYIFGFLMGALLVSFLFKGRSCKLPGTLKLEELCSQRLEFTDLALCKMECQKIDTEEISRLLKEGKINFKISDVHAKPCPSYTIEGKTKSGNEVRIIFADCDTITRVITAVDLKLKNDSCLCKTVISNQ